MTIPTININGPRLWASVHEMAQIGATPKGGVKRLAFSDLDRQGRDRFIDHCLELNMEISRDPIGNIFALMPGEDPDLPVVGIGSHLDSQPTGGKYDGALGVMVALEIARAVYEGGERPKRGLEIINFANEEGARFAPPMMGSGLFAGKFDLETMLATRDVDGITIREAIEQDQTGSFPARPKRPIHSFFELHIEQGPILEDEELPIGIVTGAQAQRWYDVEIVGFDSHAGPTPMTHRKDALLGAAEIALAVEQLALEYAPDGRGTVGTLSLTPFSRNVVPGSVRLTIDTRHPSDDALLEMKTKLNLRLTEIGNKRKLGVKLTPFWYAAATPFDDDLKHQLTQSAETRQIPFRQLWSGAGHDAVYMAQMGIPTAMVFIQTKDGISHNESESIQEEHALAGTSVLCDVVVSKLFN